MYMTPGMFPVHRHAARFNIFHSQANVRYKVVVIIVNEGHAVDLCDWKVQGCDTEDRQKGWDRHVLHDLGWKVQ